MLEENNVHKRKLDIQNLPSSKKQKFTQKKIFIQFKNTKSTRLKNVTPIPHHIIENILSFLNEEERNTLSLFHSKSKKKNISSSNHQKITNNTDTANNLQPHTHKKIPFSWDDVEDIVQVEHPQTITNDISTVESFYHKFQGMKQKHEFVEAHLLTFEQMEENGYPINVPGYIETQSGGTTDYLQLLCMDCEMCETTHGMELTKVTLIDENLTVLYDSFVKPENEILDYKTRYSGIDKSTLQGVTTTLKDAQREVLKFLKKETILVGHSLENDLHALRIIHKRIIDTAIIYRPKGDGMTKPKLKTLAKKYLGKIIQKNVHDSFEDAKTTMELVQLKMSYINELPPPHSLKMKEEKNTISQEGLLCIAFYFLTNGTDVNLVIDVLCETFPIVPVSDLQKRLKSRGIWMNDLTKILESRKEFILFEKKNKEMYVALRHWPKDKERIEPIKRKFTNSQKRNQYVKLKLTPDEREQIKTSVNDDQASNLVQNLVFEIYGTIPVFSTYALKQFKNDKQEYYATEVIVYDRNNNIKVLKKESSKSKKNSRKKACMAIIPDLQKRKFLKMKRDLLKEEDEFKKKILNNVDPSQFLHNTTIFGNGVKPEYYSPKEKVINEDAGIKEFYCYAYYSKDIFSLVELKGFGKGANKKEAKKEADYDLCKKLYEIGIL